MQVITCFVRYQKYNKTTFFDTYVYDVTKPNLSWSHTQSMIFFHLKLGQGNVGMMSHENPIKGILGFFIKVKNFESWLQDIK